MFYENVAEGEELYGEKKGIQMEKINKLLDNNIGRLLKKKNRHKLPDRVMNSPRCQKFLHEQKNIFMDQ